MSIPHITWTSGPTSAIRIPVTAFGCQREPPPVQLRLLTIREIATACQLSEKAVRRAIEDGELAAVKLRSRVRVTRPDFEAWIAAQRQQRVPRTATAPTPSLGRRAPAGAFRALVKADLERGRSR